MEDHEREPARRRAAEKRRKKETHPVVLHADPRGDVIRQLQRKQPVLELLEVHLVLVHFLRQRRIDPLRDPRLELLADLEQPVYLLVVLLDELGEEPHARGRIGGEGGEEGGDDRENVLNVFVRRRAGSSRFLLLLVLALSTRLRESATNGRPCANMGDPYKVPAPDSPVP